MANPGPCKIAHMLKLTPVALALSFATHSLYAASQTPPTLKQEIKWLQEESYVTTATKTNESIEKSGAAVTVVTEKQIEDMGARNLMDVLKRVAGLSIGQFNVGGASVEVRGVKTDYSEKVLFLIDGHPLNNNLVNGGSTWSFNNFIVDDISRVEIVRGPGSALYGANAFVAVINIITKSGAEADGLEGALTTGEHNTWSGNLLYGYKNNQTELSINLNGYDTDGFEGKIESDAQDRSGKTSTWEERYELGFKLAIADFSLHGKVLKRKAGAFAGIINLLNDGSIQRYDEHFIEGAYRFELSEQADLQLSAYHDYFSADNFWEQTPIGADPADPDGLLAASPAKFERTGMLLQAQYNPIPSNKLLVGITGEHQTQYDVGLFINPNPVESSEMIDISDVENWNGSHNRNIKAIFLQDIWDIIPSLRLIAGARYDDYSDFGSTFNPRASITWEVKQDYNLVFAHGSAFRAPTFGELYNINNPSIIGNPEVQPEEIDTQEISLNFAPNPRMQGRVTWFRNAISDLIAPRASNNAVNVSDNVGSIDTQGLELELNARLQNGSYFTFNHTYQYPIDSNDQRVHDVPINKGNLSYTYRFDRTLSLFTGLNYKSSSKRVEGDNRNDVAGYGTVDLSLNYKPADLGLKASLSIYNLLDKTYVTPSPNVMLSDYPKDGRNIQAKITYKFF